MRTVQPVYADKKGEVVPCPLYTSKNPLSAINGMEVKELRWHGINEPMTERQKLGGTR